MKSIKINLKNNQQSKFYNNQIGVINNFYYNFPQFDNNINFDLRNSGKFVELFENKKIMSTPVLRHEIQNFKMEQLIRFSQLYNYQPTLRLYGCFSSLSTIRQQSETSDLAQLELLEKRYLINFIKLNFETRIIITLDMDMIFSNNTYSVEQYNERCNDLINTIKKLEKYKNLKIVIDNETSMETMYIFDTLLISYMPVILFDNELITYNNVIFDSDLHNIINNIKKFDQRFYYLEKSNTDFCKMIYCTSKEEYLRIICNNKRNNYFNNKKEHGLRYSG